MISFFKMRKSNLENIDYDETTNYNSNHNNEEKKSDAQIVKDTLKDFNPNDCEAKKHLIVFFLEVQPEKNYCFLHK